MCAFIATEWRLAMNRMTAFALCALASAGSVSHAHADEPGSARSNAPPDLRMVDAAQPDGHDFSVVHAFSRDKSRSDGAHPNCPPTRMNDGSLLGTTSEGGAMGQGTIYRIAPDGTETIVHEFGLGSDGALPNACPLAATDQHAYGTAAAGGANGGGIAYRIDMDGSNYTVLHDFDPSGSGVSTPVSALVEMRTDGNFYGTALGGEYNKGTIYRMSPEGDVALLYAFPANGSHGIEPGWLIRGTDNNLYGTAQGGAGNIFRLRLDGTFKVLHYFDSVKEGDSPYGPILEGESGTFYGTLWQNGPRGLGSIYRLKPSGKLSIVHAFGSDPGEGRNPMGLSAGFYGVTMHGGDNAGQGLASGEGTGVGTVYRVTPHGGKVTILHKFSTLARGQLPAAGLATGADGYLYGACINGGEHTNQVPWGLGTVFRILPGKAPDQ
jgi:uncharacterized repeat protein (TIGR03803 family)